MWCQTSVIYYIVCIMYVNKDTWIEQRSKNHHFEKYYWIILKLIIYTLKKIQAILYAAKLQKNTKIIYNDADNASR